MLTEQEILTIAEAYVASIEEKMGEELIIGHEFTIRKPYGNIFFYNSKKFIDTENDKYAIAGNSPFLVENKQAVVYVFGTSQDIDYYIKEYESGTWESSSAGVWKPDNQ